MLKGAFFYSSSDIQKALSDPGASGPGGIYNQIRASMGSSSSGGGGGGSSSPAPAPSGGGTSAGGGGQAQYNTVNGLQTLASMAQQLTGVGYNGATDPQSILDAYSRTTGGAVSPSGTSASGGGSGGGGVAPAQGSNQQLLAGLDSQLNTLMQALSSTNAQDFQEKVREFNQTQSNWLQQFNAQFGGVLPDGGQTLAAKQQQFDQAIQAAGLTGVYNGQPTLAGQAQQAALTGMFNGQPTPAYQQEQAQLSGMFNGQPTEAAREFNVNTQSDLAKLASSLSGPADYFKYLTALNGGRSILNNLTTGQAQPAGGAPVGATQPQTLDNIMSRLGIGQQGAAPNTNTGSGVALPFGQGQLPYMNQIQPTAYNSMSPSAQQFIQGAYAAAGYDPADLQRSILAGTPASASGTGAENGATNFGNTNSQSLFG